MQVGTTERTTMVETTRATTTVETLMGTTTVTTAKETMGAATQMSLMLPSEFDGRIMAASVSLTKHGKSTATMCI